MGNDWWLLKTVDTVRSRCKFQAAMCCSCAELMLAHRIATPRWVARFVVFRQPNEVQLRQHTAQPTGRWQASGGGRTAAPTTARPASTRTKTPQLLSGLRRRAPKYSNEISSPTRPSKSSGAVASCSCLKTACRLFVTLRRSP